MQVKLYSPRFVMRVLDEMHATLVVDYLRRNISFFQPSMPKIHAEYLDPLFQYKQLKAQRLAMESGQSMRFFIFSQSDKKQQYIVGDIQYNPILRGALQTCFLGYRVDERMTGKGCATEALRRTNRYIFEKQGLHRIEAQVHADNEASLRVLEKLSFVYEGIAHASIEIDGHWLDHKRYAKVNPWHKI